MTSIALSPVVLVTWQLDPFWQLDRYTHAPPPLQALQGREHACVRLTHLNGRPAGACLYARHISEHHRLEPASQATPLCELRRGERAHDPRMAHDRDRSPAAPTECEEARRLHR